MGLYDRDYMRNEESFPPMPRFVIAVGLLISLIASTTYLLKEFRYFSRETKALVRTPTEHDKLLAISPLDLNTATYAELVLLPHVTDVRATEIMNMRPITTIEQLDDVVGIGSKRLSSIRPHVYVDTATLETRFPKHEILHNAIENHQADSKE